MNLEFHITTFTRKLESVSAKLFYEQNSSKSAIKLISELLIKYGNEVWSSASHSAFFFTSTSGPPNRIILEVCSLNS